MYLTVRAATGIFKRALFCNRALPPFILTAVAGVDQLGLDGRRRRFDPRWLVHRLLDRRVWSVLAIFACLVIQRRSFGICLKNRALKIVLPSVLFLPPIDVLFEFQNRVGGLLSTEPATEE